MLSKNQLKKLKGLQRKKERKNTGLFVVEGKKIVAELLHSSAPYQELYALPCWFEANPIYANKENSFELSERDLAYVSSLATPNEVFMVLNQFETSSFDQLNESSTILALDGVKDPGNLGTIIRLADWFGISHVLCTKNSVDLYNPKTVQSAMGSINKVQLHYGDLPEMFSKFSTHKIYAFDLTGSSIYTTDFAKKSILLMGSESHGISEELLKIADLKVTIPSFSNSGIDSLNVATATSIALSQYRSKSVK